MFGFVVTTVVALQAALAGKEVVSKASKTKLGKRVSSNVNGGIKMVSDSQPVRTVRSTKLVKSAEKGCSRVADFISDQLNVEEVTSQQTSCPSMPQDYPNPEGCKEHPDTSS